MQRTEIESRASRFRGTHQLLIYEDDENAAGDVEHERKRVHEYVVLLFGAHGVDFRVVCTWAAQSMLCTAR